MSAGSHSVLFLPPFYSPTPFQNSKALKHHQPPKKEKGNNWTGHDMCNKVD